MVGTRVASSRIIMAKTFRNFQVGSKVRLTGKFLKNTGQHRSPEARSTWTITGITSNGWAITNERLSDESLKMFTAEELAADPSLAFRRIALANLHIVGQADSRNDP